MGFQINLPFEKNLLRIAFTFDFKNSDSGATVELSINGDTAWYTFIQDREGEEPNQKVGVFEEFLYSVSENEAKFEWKVLQGEDKKITDDFFFGVSSLVVKAISQ